MSKNKEFAAKLEQLARQGVELRKSLNNEINMNDPGIISLLERGRKLQDESRIALADAGKSQPICVRCGATYLNNDTDPRRTGHLPHAPFWPKEGDLLNCTTCQEWMQFTSERLRVVTADVFQGLSKKKRRRIQLVDRIHRELTALNCGEISKVTATYATSPEESG